MKKKWLAALLTAALIIAYIPVLGAEPLPPVEEHPVPPAEAGEGILVFPQETDPIETEGPLDGIEPVGPEEEGPTESGSVEVASEPEEIEPPPEEEEPPVLLGGKNLALVGLAYEKGTLDGANLKNSVGSGYRLGFLDGERYFYSLAYTGETDISIVKTQNVYYGTYQEYTSYFDEITSGILVGCWHVLLPYTPANFEEAQQLAWQTGGFPAWIAGEYQVRYGAFSNQQDAQAAAEASGGKVVGTSAYGVSVVKTGTATILFQFDGREERSLCVWPGLDDSVKTVTWFKSVRYYGAFQYQRIGGGDLTVVNAVDIDDYANCVISQEMSPSWPLEALKAQAICARNYYQTSSGNHKGFDVCPTMDCQAYPGMGQTNERTAQAAAETARLRAWYQGKYAETYYFSSDGGGTEACNNVWQRSYPYLCGVIDPYEALVEDKIPGYHWTRYYTSAQLTEKLQNRGYGNSAIVDVQLDLTPTGNVKTLKFIDSNGKTWPFTKERDVRNFLGFRSMRYSVSASEKVVEAEYHTPDGGLISAIGSAWVIGGDGIPVQLAGEQPYIITSAGIQPLALTDSGSSALDRTFTFTGTGWGHNVGMSQWGAYAMAQAGFTFDQILTFYYPGIEIY